MYITRKYTIHHIAQNTHELQYKNIQYYQTQNPLQFNFKVQILY